MTVRIMSIAPQGGYLSVYLPQRRERLIPAGLTNGVTLCMKSLQAIPWPAMVRKI